MPQPRLRHAAMIHNFGWDMSARRYIEVDDSFLPQQNLPSNREPKQAA
jgi:hypothetical protein